MDSENKKIETSVDNLIDPESLNNPKQDIPTKTINIKNDGIVERESPKVVTNDGRELLKDSI